MGPQMSPIERSAATLAGGAKNQDRFAHGDRWAFVLDGASSFDSLTPEHDGGWYASRLSHALAQELRERPQRETAALVSKAIASAAKAHKDPATCPTSTVALVRWCTERVEVYVLGDSAAIVITDAGEQIVADDRISRIAPEVRQRYRERLASGAGFDEEHRKLLRRLQAAQKAAMNQPNGYWIAGATPEAADHAMVRSWPRTQVDAVILASDGALDSMSRVEESTSWLDLATEPAVVLDRARERENEDHMARRWPRSKIHDDKTAVAIRFSRQLYGQPQ